MPDAVILNISEKSDDPMLDLGAGVSKTDSLKYLAFIFLIIFPITVLSMAVLLYPFPPQIDVYFQCDTPGLLSRTEYKALKIEYDQTEKKLLSINNDLAVPYISYDSYRGYKIAKEMLEEYKTDLYSNIQQQKILWKQCIEQNLVTGLEPIKLQLQTFIIQIICFSITVIFMSVSVYVIFRNSLKTETKILFTLCFLIQSSFIVITASSFLFISIYYCEIWNLNSDRFVD